jgi:hypothetical protein
MRPSLGLRRFLVLVLTACRTAGAESSTGAERPQERPAAGTAWQEDPVSLELHFGAGSPVGSFGVTAEYSLLPEIGVGASFGAGSSWGEASWAAVMQKAVFARLRPLYGARDAFVANVSYSTGGYNKLDDGFLDFGPEPDDYGAEVAHWGHVDIGWEKRLKTGFVFRPSVGVARMLNPGDIDCVPGDDGVCEELDNHQHGLSIYVMDLAFGASF